MEVATAERLVILVVVILAGLGIYRFAVDGYKVAELRERCEKDGGVLLRRSYTGFFSTEKAYFCLPKGAERG